VSKLLRSSGCQRRHCNRFSGAPIVIFPTDDDQAVGKDGSLNNNFRDYPVDQSYCPFAAHTRKSGPRSDLPPDEVEKHAILRDGVYPCSLRI
jgi:deferrochelatase/peroxidase EfeB